MSYTPRILIVDDEPQMCESLRQLLQRQGYEILSANSGRDALSMLDVYDFDLMLLDMVMPDMDGFQVIDHISSYDTDTLIIVITGNASLESAVRALRKGAYDYLKKPFEYDELLKRVGNALERKKLVHEKKIINDRLARSEKRYQYLVQNSPDIIYMLDKAGNFIFVNITVERLLGYHPAQLLGRHFTEIVHDTDVEKARHFVARPAATRLELQLKVSDDPGIFKLMEIEHASLDVRDANAEIDLREISLGTYGVARDITYRKKLEVQLQHAKKMEAIGTLAGGIAHDFNNILMGIMGYTSLILTTMDKKDAWYEKLKNIEQHVLSGAHLTKQLLGFARGGKYDVKPTDINDLMERTAGMFGRTKKEIGITSSLQEGLWVAEADRGQIEQVLFNLYVNAWQAMPEGGELFLETENVFIDEHYSEQVNVRTGKYVKLTVRDTGIGMDDDVRQRVFEPFFSTKEPGKGTGLGLASAYGIIKNHGGDITVSSTRGAGTTFRVYLPATDQPVVREQGPAGGIVHGAETVLLVDDEETMLDVGRELLEALGYTVMTAGSARKALELYRTSGAGVDIIIMDLVMPEMGGGELYDAFKIIDPDVRTLLSSGYSLTGEAEEIMKRGCNGFIQKPFGMQELAEKLRSILDGS